MIKMSPGWALLCVGSPSVWTPLKLQPALTVQVSPGPTGVPSAFSCWILFWKNQNARFALPLLLKRSPPK